MTTRSPGPAHDTPPVAIVGAGAAGLLAALFAARAEAPVVLLERTDDGGRKVLVSGGGRCNILPSRAQPERYVTDSSANTLRKILRSWPLAEQRRFFEAELGMALNLEKETGKLFPASHRARDVRDTLATRVREAGARIWLGARATGVTPLATPGPAGGGRWRVTLEGAPALDAAAVVLATGGLSVPTTGSDGFGLTVARQLGHRMRETYPALTPLTADPHPHAALAGVSLTVTIRAPGSRPPFSTTGGLVFTHRGWSGPAVLDASHLTTRPRPDGTRQELHVTWSPLGPDAWAAELSGGRGTARGALARHLPRSLADHLVEEAGLSPDTRLAQLRRPDRTALVSVLTNYRLPWTASGGYEKAEVTGGGVALEEVNPVTLESRRAQGLFLCGEMLDAFGPIGGHNFLWAWTTGRAAGLGAAASLQG